MTKNLLASLILTGFLAACANDPNAVGGYGSGGGINKQTIGTGVGALGGGLLGAQLGGGKGRLWTTGAGVLLGALAGNAVGSSLDKADQAYANQAFKGATAAPVGQPITWSNPDSGNSGTYVVNRTGRTASGASCREFTQTIMIGGKSQQGVGTACQQPDGSWAIQGQ